MTRPLAAALLILLSARELPAQQPGTVLSTPQVAAALGRLLDSLAAADRFSGVVVLTEGGAPVFERAVGMADRARGRPATLDTRFNLGSINKAFTATAIRQLAAQGRLTLDDRLIRHLPDYPNRAVAEQVTLRQLMEHTAGIGGNIFGAPAGGTRAQIRTNNDFIPLFAAEPPAFAPGTSRRYCNACYVLLGAVVERVSGMSYYDYVRRNVFAPAGMEATDSYALDSLPPNTAIGYTRGGPGAPSGPLRSNADLLPGRGSAAGGGYSTARDLLALARGAGSRAARRASTRCSKRASRGATRSWCWRTWIRPWRRRSAGACARGWARGTTTEARAVRGWPGDGERFHQQAPRGERRSRATAIHAAVIAAAPPSSQPAPMLNAAPMAA